MWKGADMQEVFEKIIEKLEERTSFLSDCTKYGNKDAEQQRKSCSTMMMYEVADLVDDLIEIVKQEAEQYTSTEHINCSSDSSTNGWIPCGERLPDDFMSFEYLTIRKGHTLATITYYCVVNHKWYLSRNSSKEIDVIAWQPLPEPYQPKVCNTSDCAYNTGKDCPAADGCAGYEPKGE